MRLWWSTSLLGLMALGCKGKTEEEAPPGAMMDVPEMEGIEVLRSIGPAPHSVWMRAFNSYGAGTSTTPAPVSVNDDSELVNFGGLGYGKLTLDDPGIYLVNGTTEVVAMASDWSGFALAEAVFGAGLPEDVVEVGAGVVTTHGNEVWWMGPGLPAHRVAYFPGQQSVAGITAAHVDDDGVMDVLAWSGDTLLLLRGRLDGGLGWGAGLRGEGNVVIGADVGDMNGELGSELAVIWEVEVDRNRIQVLHSDSPWTFEHRGLLTFTGEAMSVSIGDNLSRGRGQATVLRVNDNWVRFTAGGDGEYVATGPELAVQMVPGTSIESGRDINADGVDDLVIVGPWDAVSVRDVKVWDLAGQTPSYMPLTPPGGHVGLGDATADGVTDVWTLFNDREVVVLSHNGVEYTQKQVASLSEHAPFALPDTDDDGVSDLVLMSDVWTVWPGAILDEEDPEWSVVLSGATVIADELISGVVQVEADGSEETRHVAAVTEALNGGALTVWSEGMMPDHTITLPEGVTDVRDLEACGAVVWISTNVGVIAVDVQSGGVVSSDWDGGGLACGTGPGGAVAAVVDGDEVVLLSDALEELGRESHAGAEDVGFWDPGTGPEVAVCTEVGCDVVEWTWGASDERVLVQSGDSMLTITHPDGAVDERAGRGCLLVSDVDADGYADLVASSGVGVVSVVRSTGEGLGPAEAWHVGGALMGAVVTDEGTSDLLYVVDGELWAAVE